MDKENLQVENGNYTRIVNEVIDKLVTFPFPDQTGVPLKIILFVIRKTWGFNKKEDIISITQFQKALGASRPTIIHWLEYPVKARLLVKGEQLGQTGTVYRFNKYSDNWEWVVKGSLLVKGRLPRWLKSSSKGGKRPLTHKRQYIQKTIKDITAETSSAEVPLLIKAFETINPASKRFYGNSTQRKACADLISAYGFERVKNVIEKTLPKTNQIEYMPTITTPLQLYEKWSSLEAGIIKIRNKGRNSNSEVAFK